MNSIGPYEIIAELGRGGMGAVFHARDTRLGREVALKLLFAHRAGDERARRRTATELATLTRLRHPNVVPALDAGEHQGAPFLALELIDGEPLEERLRRGPLPVEAAVRLARELAGALTHVHAQGVLHRDLKPANVLLRRSDDAALLTDFGLALDLEASYSRVSKTGVFLGTPGYWAPEQARGEIHALSPATDIYGLGAVLYAALTGRPPVQGETLMQLLETIRFRRMTPPQRQRPDVPDWLNELCMRCLQISPEARPASAEEVERALVLGGSADTGKQSRRRLAWGLLGGVVALLAGFAVTEASRGDDSPLPAPAPGPALLDPALPVDTPGWYRDLPPERRPPVPLPRGLTWGKDPGDFLNEPDGTTLRWIPGGSFEMGNRDGEEDEQPVRRVTLAQGFFLAKHETTWEQYRQFCRATGRSLPKNELNTVHLGGGRFTAPANHPVFNVTRDDARAYSRWAGLRLPSEAEWEYAARGPTGRRYPWGDQAPEGARLNVADQSAPWDLPAIAKAPWSDEFPYTAPVGSFPAGVSPFGCLDMAGNVAECVEDDYQDSYRGAPTDGSALEPNGARGAIFRGGSWSADLEECRAAYRLWIDFAGEPYLGFRPARSYAD